VRCDGSDVSIKTSPLNIIGTNGAQKSQDSFREVVVSFISFGTVLAGSKLEEGHVQPQQVLKCRVVTRQETLPQRFDVFR
jgi:hypothetical protein